MRLHKLQLSQIKSYDEATVEFADGTNSISGPNGAGKTTILEAIGFALFDSLPYKQSQFIRDGSTSGRIVVTLQDGFGRVYEVERRIGSGAAWFVYDPELRDRPAEGSADVKAWLRAQFGTDDDAGGERLFQNAVGVPQGQLTAPFVLTPGQRRDVFDPILGVNEYQEAFEALNETRTHLNDRIQKQQVLIAELSVDADRIAEFEAVEAETREHIDRLRGELAGINAEQSRVQETVSLIEAQEKHIASLRSLVVSLKASLDADRQAAANAAARLDRAWEAQETVQASGRGHALYEAAERRLSVLEERHSALLTSRQTADRLVVQIDQHQREVAALADQTAAAEAAERSLPGLSERAAELRAGLDRLSAAEAELRRLPALLEQQARVQSQSETVRERLSRTLEAIVAAERCSDEAEQLQERQRELDAARSDVTVAKEAAHRLAAVESDRARKRQALAAQEMELHNLRAEATVSPEEETLAERLAQIQADLEGARSEREEMQARWRELRAHQSAAEESCPLSLQECIAERRRRAGALAGELESVKSRGTAATQLMDRLTAEASAAQKAAAKLSAVRSQEATLRALDAAAAQLRSELETLDDTERQLRSRAEQLEGLESTVRTLDADVQSAQAAAAKVAALSSLTASSSADEQTLQSLELERGRLESEARALAGLEQEIEELRATLAGLRGADEQYAAAANTARQLSSLRTQMDETRSAESAAVESLAALQPALKELSEVEGQIQQARLERQQYAADHQRYLSSERLAQELPEREREAKAAQQKLVASETQLAEQQEALAAALSGWDEDRLRQARARHSELVQEGGRLTGTIAGLGRELKQVQQQLESCRDTFRRREEAEQEKARLGGLLETLSFARQTIKSAQAPVTEALLHSISSEARTLYSAIVDDYSARLAWTPSYEVTLERGRERLTFAQLSGGEQMSAALAVRLALLKKLSTIDLAFLDEPTQNMDEQRRSNLAAQVSALRGYGQLFVISHDDTFHQHVNHSIMVSKQDGVSVVTVGR